VKFKVDENLPVEVADLLGLAGHDATTVLAQNLGGSPDHDLVSVCQDEDRALITLVQQCVNPSTTCSFDYH